MKGKKLQGEQETGKKKGGRRLHRQLKARNRKKTKMYENIDSYYTSVVTFLLSIKMM
jgi:hypothetical protein